MKSTSYSLALIAVSTIGLLIAWLVVPPSYIEENDAMFKSGVYMGAGIIIAGWLHKLVSSRLGNAVSYNKSRKKE